MTLLLVDLMVMYVFIDTMMIVALMDMHVLY